MSKAVIYGKTLNTYYQLIDIELRKDESIYIYFPRKKGYLIKSKHNVNLNGKEQKTISFDKNLNKNVFNPYISFHPGKGAIHINAHTENNETVFFLRDRPVHTLGEIVGSQSFVPFVTVVIPPNISGFDSSDSKKENGTIVMNTPKGMGHALSIDLLIHERGGYVEKEDLPYVRRRQIIEMFRLEDGKPHKLTYTLAFNDVPANDGEKSTDLFAFIWNKALPFAFCLTPRD